MTTANTACSTENGAELEPKLPVVIAKAGRPMVRVTALDAPTGPEVRRLGFLAGETAVPEDFDRMGEEEIADLFGAP